MSDRYKVRPQATDEDPEFGNTTRIVPKIEPMINSPLEDIFSEKTSIIRIEPQTPYPQAPQPKVAPHPPARPQPPPPQRRDTEAQPDEHWSQEPGNPWHVVWSRVGEFLSDFRESFLPVRTIGIIAICLVIALIMYLAAKNNSTVVNVPQVAKVHPASQPPPVAAPRAPTAQAPPQQVPSTGEFLKALDAAMHKTQDQIR